MEGKYEYNGIGSETLRQMGYTMPPEETPEFRTLLKHFRERKNMSQGKLGEKIGVSGSYIGLLERSVGDPPRDINRLEGLVEALELGVGERVQFFRTLLPLKRETSLATIWITPEEEAYTQSKLKEGTVLWVVAKNLLDTGVLYATTLKNIDEHNVRYVYFQPEPYAFWSFYDKLHGDLERDNSITDSTALLESSVECILAPPWFFTSSFIIGNPGQRDMFGKTSLHDDDGKIAHVFPFNEAKLRETYGWMTDIYREIERNGVCEDRRGYFERVFPKR